MMVDVITSWYMICLRCGHGWYKRIPGRPIKCPICQAKDWDKPKEGEHT